MHQRAYPHAHDVVVLLIQAMVGALAPEIVQVHHLCRPCICIYLNSFSLKPPQLATLIDLA